VRTTWEVERDDAREKSVDEVAQDGRDMSDGEIMEEMSEGEIWDSRSP
jgi:hypothetical protein